jgi:hypothetical protein
MKRIVLALTIVLAWALGARGDVQLHWLDQSPPGVPQGVSWGVPWAQGAVAKDTAFSLKDAQGKDVAVQSWPLAYWPDGSLKWTGFAATADGEMGNSLTVLPGKDSPPPKSPVVVTQKDDVIEVANGAAVWTLGTRGSDLIQSIKIDDREVARDGRLVGQIEDRSDWDSKQTLRYADFSSEIDSAAVEQAGPVRAVVKITGKHKFDGSNRAWLPFIVRLYFYAGSDSVRMVHTFIFDGDQEKDFIHGLGVRFSVPMREEFQNRHVRLAGDQGFFAEPIRVIVGRRNPGAALYVRQIAGKRIPNLDALAKLPSGNNIADMAVWDSYKLTQLSPDGFSIQKRTNPQSAWINAVGGKRSIGLAFVGDVSGGLAIDLRNFWKLYPTELEIENASKDAADVTVWLWSPEAPAMDMRHYDTHAHGLDASYEDVQPGFSSAYGVARTSELTLRPYADVPSDQDLLAQAKADQEPALPVCSPEYYHSLAVFGIWSLPDRATPGKSWVEDQLDKAFSFYHGQVEQRRWYGFWDFGDVMHTYDTTRHEWRYDIGGFAWDDTELAPNLWLWYAFLRSGRADIFRMAEALTRQSQEVDVYHIGPWKGLGSRHNVRHWGDGAKEVRISQSLFKRFYYYLTTDERTGDLMTDEIDADQALLVVDPLRELPGISDEHQYPTHIRIGPDWFALVSNWFTAWERTGDAKYKDRILAGMNSITSMPNGIASGENFGYDPKTGELHPLPPDSRRPEHATPSLLLLFGGPELNFEMVPVINDPAWTKAWNQLCAHAGSGGNNARMMAYSAYLNKNPGGAARAWEEFLGGSYLNPTGVRFDSYPVSSAAAAEPIDEIRNVSTNSTAQWCLNAIELLQLAPDQMPADPGAVKSNPPPAP